MKRTLKQKIADALYAFKHGRVEIPNGSMKVYSLLSEDEKDGIKSMNSLLHIEEDRADEIIAHVMACKNTNKYTSDSISVASEFCRNPNELFFMARCFTKAERQANPLSFLSNLFGA